MASLIGALKVTLGLETAAFETGAARASARARYLGDDVEKLGNRVGTLTKVLGAAAMAAVGSQVFQAVSGLVKSGLDHASALGEQAKQLGVTTTELQEYRHAASQAGIEQETMDKSLAKLTLTIGKAAAGAKGPAAAFKELGISLTKADGTLLTAGEAFPKIADALAKIPDPANRAKIEVELFGRAGQQLDTLLSGGANAVNELRAAAHKMGIVLSPEMIQRADDAADKLAAVQQVMQAKIAATVAENAGAILSVANALLAVVTASAQAIRAYQNWRKEMANRLDQNTVDGWFTSPEDRKAAQDRINARNTDSRVIVAGGGKVTPSANRPKSGFGAPLNLDPAKLGTQWSTVPLSKKYSRANYAGGGGAGPFDRFAQSSWTGGLGEIDQISHAGNRADGGEAMRKVAESIVAGMEAINRRSPETIGNVSALRREFDGMGKAAVNNTAMASRGAEQMKVSFEESAQGIIGALSRLEGSFSGGGFLDKLAAFLGLGLQIKGLLGGNAALAGAAHSASNRLPGRWSGGPVMANRAYMVGERGPELFVPGSNGGIVPNHAMGGAGAGPMRIEVVPSQYFDVRVQQNIAQAAPAIVRAGAQGGEARVIRRQARRVY